MLLLLLTLLGLFCFISIFDSSLSTGQEAFSGLPMAFSFSCPSWLIHLMRHIDRQLIIFSHTLNKLDEALLSSNNSVVKLRLSVVCEGLSGVKDLKAGARNVIPPAVGIGVTGWR
jgi:hypothetical protein